MTMDARDAQHYARHALMVFGFSAVVAIGLGIAKGGNWTLQFVYAESIGLCIWAFTDFGRLLFRRDPDSDWPTGWRALVLQVFAVVAGYLLGTVIGDQYCGCSTFEIWRHSARTFAGYLVLSIAISAAISFFFLARGRDQRRLRQLAMAQRDASEAQLKLLESQLEPHMLFNTLANLRALIGVDPVRAQAMLDQLIAFLRATLSASRQPSHPLAAEFARLGDYLQLMQVRMADRLQTRLTLPPELAGVPVPPLVLQPLVENAIKHGLEPHVGGGRIEISAARRGDRLVLTVRDTGLGLSEGSAAGGSRFGLTQVRTRLATIYGAEATLELTAAADREGGTVATVSLPMASAAASPVAGANISAADVCRSPS
jgi:signal transduction histidine kinase